MPYKRPYRKRPYRKRRVNRKPKPTVASVNRKVMKIQQAIEYKHLDTFYSNTVGLSGTIFPITNALSGLLDTNRVGDKITTTSVMLKYQLSQHDTPFNTFRIVVIRSRAANQVPNMSDIYVVGSGLQAAHPGLWHYNIDYFRSSKAKIVYDRVHTLQGPNAAEPRVITVSKKVPFRQNVQFIGGSTQANNQLFVVIVSDSGTPNHPLCQLNARINYFDL